MKIMLVYEKKNKMQNAGGIPVILGIFSADSWNEEEYVVWQDTSQTRLGSIHLSSPTTNQAITLETTNKLWHGKYGFRLDTTSSENNSCLLHEQLWSRKSNRFEWRRVPPVTLKRAQGRSQTGNQRPLCETYTLKWTPKNLTYAMKKSRDVSQIFDFVLSRTLR